MYDLKLEDSSAGFIPALSFLSQGRKGETLGSRMAQNNMTEKRMRKMCLHKKPLKNPANGSADFSQIGQNSILLAFLSSYHNEIVDVVGHELE